MNTAQLQEVAEAFHTVLLIGGLGRPHRFGKSPKLTTALPMVIPGVLCDECQRPVPAEEVFCPDMPGRPGSRIPEYEGGLIPTDRYLGCYFPEMRRVEIYYNSIQYFAKLLQCDPSALEWIVRVHEFAHAQFHLGLDPTQDARLRISNPAVPLDTWSSFLRARTAMFNATDEDTHEFIAQGLTWAALGCLPDEAGRGSAEAAFENLLRCQSSLYQLDAHERVAWRSGNWGYFAEEARTGFPNKPGDSTTTRQWASAMISAHLR